MPDDRSPPTVVPLTAGLWREGVVMLARELAGAVVLALSTAAARRTLRLGSTLAGLQAEAEPRVVSLGRIARLVGTPVQDAESAAALVGEAVPETPDGAATLLVKLAEKLAEHAGVGVDRLADLADGDVPTDFDFGERAFGRAELLALPEAPGVYLFEDAEGDVLYVGKARDLRRRVSSYFGAAVDERAQRIRDAAHGLSVQLTGTELTALLREHELIRELAPSLNTQEHVRPGSKGSHAAGSVPRLPQELALVHPSASGGVEVVLVDRARGVIVGEVLPHDPDDAVLPILHGMFAGIRDRPRTPASPEVEVALRWLASRGAGASVVDTGGDVGAAVALLWRLARDPDVRDGRIFPVT